MSSNPNSEILNPNGAFVRERETNTFYVALKPPDVAIKWRDIETVQLASSLVNGVNDAAFEHIRITAIDRNGGTQVLVDEPYETGNLTIKNGPDDEGTSIILPVSRPPPPSPAPGWSTEQIEDEVNRTRLLDHLKDHASYYGRAVYFGRDGLQRATELDGVKLTDGSNVLEKIENRPVDMIGDYMAFPGTDSNWNDTILSSLPPLGSDDIVLDERLVALPTRGVFAEAKLGHCNASELIDNTRFWDWQSSPIPHMAPEIAPITGVTPQPQQQNLAASPLPSSIVNIVNPPNAPDPTGMSAALNLLATPNIFRDMSGRTGCRYSPESRRQRG
jgi:hypothetical protein